MFLENKHPKDSFVNMSPWSKLCAKKRIHAHVSNIEYFKIILSLEHMRLQCLLGICSLEGNDLIFTFLKKIYLQMKFVIKGRRHGCKFIFQHYNML